VGGSGVCLLTGLFTGDYCNITEETIKGHQSNDKHAFTRNTIFDVMRKRKIQLTNTAAL
jgi:subtilase family serine protease